MQFLREVRVKTSHMVCRSLHVERVWRSVANIAPTLRNCTVEKVFGMGRGTRARTLRSDLASDLNCCASDLEITAMLQRPETDQRIYPGTVKV